MEIRGNSPGLDSQRPSNIDRSGQVKTLSNDQGAFDLENVSRPVHTFVSCKTGVIQKYVFRRDSVLTGIPTHRSYFVVRRFAVVAAQQELLNLFGSIELNAPIHSVLQDS